jgi:general secretion pathway protein H
MILRSERRSRAAMRAGFTLIEVIVTLAILGLALVLIAGYKPPWSRGLGLRGTASELAAGLRSARAEAILRNRPVALELDVAGHRYRVGEGAVRTLPPQITVALLTITGERQSATVSGIRFNPDGSSTGGRISIVDGTRGIAIGVDWLSGQVRIGDER